jgi:hypothetical protein
VIFSSTELFLVSLIFMWAGFVRTGLGFGGAALGLPLMLSMNICICLQQVRSK